MHNHFLDKRRRYLRLQPDQVDLILPEHFAGSYPKFINLLEFYYEFQEEEKSTELLHHLFATRDITETDITLLSYIEDELLLGDAYFESFASGDAQKRAAANFSNTLFRSKGTKFAIQWFFRSFFGIDAEVVETQNQVFKLNEPSSSIGSSSLKFLTDDKLYQTFAYLVRSSIPISTWKDIFKLFVHPAGMYLGGELLIEDAGIISALTEDTDGAASTRTSPTFALTTTPSTSESEGTTFDFELTVSNLPDNIGTYQYFLRLDSTTSQSDFDFSADSFPDSDNKQLFNTSPSGGNSVATIQIPTLHDSTEGEGDEKFTLFIADTENRNVAHQQVTMQDVIASYTMTPSATTIDEGDSVQFSVVGSSVPNNGSTTLLYQIIPVGDSADSDADFASGSFPSTGLGVPFNIRNDSGSFSVQTKIDGRTEGQEHFTVKLFTQSGILKDSAYISMNNVAPTFSASPAILYVTEGNDIQVSVNVDPTTVGTDVDFVISAGDGRITNKSGSFTLTGTNDTYTLSTTEITDAFETSTTSSLTLTTNSSGLFSPELQDASIIDVQNQIRSFTEISTDTLSIRNGDTVQFTVEGTNIPDGNSGKYFIDHIDTNNLDFSVAPPTDSASADNISFTSNSGSVSLTFSDSSELSNEDFDFVVLGGADSEVLRSTFTIIGNQTYDLSVSAGDSDVGEQTLNPSVNAVFTTTDADGTYYYYIAGTNITSDDFSSGYAAEGSRESFSVIGGTANITVASAQDYRREGNETFRIYVSKTSTGGVVSQTPDINLIDSSVPTYTLSMADITEGNTLTAIVTPNSSNTTETIYVDFRTTTGDSASITTAQPIGQSMSGAGGAKSFITSTGVSDSDHTTVRRITANARINSHTGLIVASDSCAILDATPSYTLTTNKTNDSADEGETFQFTFGGSNVPTATYHYNVSDVKPKTTDQSISAGSTIIYLSDTTNLTTGMEVRGIDFPSETTISLINAGNYVTMSSGNTEVGTVSSGTTVHFALPAVFEDFANSGGDAFGTFSHTTNTSTNFNVETTDTDDTPTSGRTTSYTMNVSETHGGSAVKTRTFTIGDDDTGTPNVQRGSMTDPDTFSSSGDAVGDPTTTTIYLLNTGEIRVNRDNTDTGDIVTDMGDWVDDTGVAFTASDFECIATLVSTSNNNSSVPGDFGTTLNLGTSRAWQVEPPIPGPSEIELASATFDLLIREVANTSNSITTRITLNATMIDFEGFE